MVKGVVVSRIVKENMRQFLGDLLVYHGMDLFYSKT